MELKKENIIASRCKIRRIMDKYGLVSNYTIKQFKIHKNTCNEDKIANEVNRKFNDIEKIALPYFVHFRSFRVDKIQQF